MHEKYGDHSYQTYRNSMYRPGRDGLLIEINTYGLAKRDLVVPVNLFSKVIVDGEVRFQFVPRHSKAGDHDNRAMMWRTSSLIAADPIAI
jgi:uncharacterized protein